MKHLVNISIAPVVVILDDRAEPLHLIAASVSFVLWLPCWLYLWLAHLVCRLPTAADSFRAYCRGWQDDLDLMAEAAWLLLVGRWVFWRVV